MAPVIGRNNRKPWNPGIVQVIMILKAAGPMGWSELVHYLGYTNSALHFLINTGKGYGLIEQHESRGPYHLTERGEIWGEGYLRAFKNTLRAARKYRPEILADTEVKTGNKHFQV